MLPTPDRPNEASLGEAGWKMGEWHSGYGTVFCTTAVSARAEWTGHFEDVVLMRTLQPVELVSDLGGTRTRRMLTPEDFIVLPASDAFTLWSAQSHTSEHCVLSGSLVSQCEEFGLRKNWLQPLTGQRLRSSLVDQLLARLWPEARAGFPSGRVFGEAATTLLAFALAGAEHRLEAARTGGLAPGSFRRAKERIRASLAEDISLMELAAEANLSPWHFSRAFRVSCGMTLTEFIGRERVAEAQRILAQTSLSILETASAIGISNPSHFARMFRKYAGCSPAEWRRNLA